MSRRAGQQGYVSLVGRKWYGRYWRDVQGKDKREHAAVVLGQKGTMTKIAARRKLMDIIDGEGINEPDYLDKVLKPAVTFNKIADKWEEQRLPFLHHSSRVVVPSRLKNNIRSFFGDMGIDNINTGVCNQFIRSLVAKGLEPKSIINCWKDFRSIVNWYRRQFDKPKVAWYPDLPALSDEEQHWFTLDEVNRLVDAAEGQYKVLFRLAGYSGLRSGELLALRIEDLKLEHGYIEVRRTIWNGVEGPTKTKAGRRNVFIDSETIRMVKDFIGDRQSGRLFQSSRGTPLANRDICRRVLRPVCEKIGIAPGRMHSFRHGRVSMLQAAMVPADFIKSQIGHSDLRITGHYTHFEHQKKREMVENLLSCTQSGHLYSVAADGNRQ